VIREGLPTTLWGRQVTVGLLPLSNVQWRQIKLQASRSLVSELARVTAGGVLPFFAFLSSCPGCPPV
jgi:hypothetical protein